MSSASGVGSSYYYASGSAAAASVHYPLSFEKRVEELCVAFNENLNGPGRYVTSDVPVRNLLKGVYKLCSQEDIKCNKDFQGWLGNLLQRKVMDSGKHTNTINVVTKLLGLNPCITIKAWYDSSWNKWTRGKENLLINELVSSLLSSSCNAPVQEIEDILKLQSQRFTDDKTPSDEDFTRLSTTASEELLSREIVPKVGQPLANAAAYPNNKKYYVEQLSTALRRAHEMELTGEQFAKQLEIYKLSSLKDVCSRLLSLDIGGYYSHFYDLDSKTWKTGDEHKSLFEDLCKYALAPPFQCNLPFNFENQADNEWFRKLSQGERFSLSSGGASSAAAAAASGAAAVSVDLARFELDMKALRIKFHKDLKNHYLHVRLEELLKSIYELCSKTGVKCNKDFQEWVRAFLKEGAEDVSDQRTLRGMDIAAALVGFNPSIQGKLSYDSTEKRWFPSLGYSGPLLKELIKNQVFLPSDPSLQKTWVRELLALQEKRFTDQPPTDDQFAPILEGAAKETQLEYDQYLQALKAAVAERTGAAVAAESGFFGPSSFDRPQASTPAAAGFPAFASAIPKEDTSEGFEVLDAGDGAPGGPNIAAASALAPALAIPAADVKAPAVSQPKEADKAPVQQGFVSRLLGSFGKFFSSIIWLFSSLFWH